HDDIHEPESSAVAAYQPQHKKGCELLFCECPMSSSHSQQEHAHRRDIFRIEKCMPEYNRVKYQGGKPKCSQPPVAKHPVYPYVAGSHAEYKKQIGDQVPRQENIPE